MDIGGVAASSQHPGRIGRARPLPTTVQCAGALTVVAMAAFMSGWSKAANTRCASSSPPCTARYVSPSASSVKRCRPAPVREYGMSASTRSSLAACNPGSGSRFPSSSRGSRSRPLSTTRRSRAGLISANVLAPGVRQPNRTTVTDPNTSSPPVTSRSTWYPDTSMSRARCCASAYVRAVTGTPGIRAVDNSLGSRLQPGLTCPIQGWRNTGCCLPRYPQTFQSLLFISGTRNSLPTFGDYIADIPVPSSPSGYSGVG